MKATTVNLVNTTSPVLIQVKNDVIFLNIFEFFIQYAKVKH